MQKLLKNSLNLNSNALSLKSLLFISLFFFVKNPIMTVDKLIPKYKNSTNLSKLEVKDNSVKKIPMMIIIPFKNIYKFTIA